MDRLEAHTRHCRSCSGALRRLQRLHRLSGVVLVAGLATLAWLGGGQAGAGAVAALLISAAALGLRWRCGVWIQQLQRGTGLPPRNRLERR
jgi:hypothetical protein